VNARHCLTLRSNNLPETGKRQYENKGTHAPSRLDGVDRRTTRKKRISAIILSAQRNAAQPDAVQHRKTDPNCWVGERINGFCRI
jgi:hypothetical protein